MSSRFAEQLLFALLLVGLTTGAWAQNGSGQNCPEASSDSRPSFTDSGIPIRWTDDPITDSTCDYETYDDSEYSYGGNIGAFNSSLRRGASEDSPKRLPLPPDPRTGRDYLMRKALEKFAQENSVGGKLYVESSAQKWLLCYDGNPVYGDSVAQIPCTGKSKGGEEQRLLLTLEFRDEDIIGVFVTTRQQ